MDHQSTVSVIGAGTMGTGLAVQFARHNWAVKLVDHRESNLTTARSRIRDIAAFLVNESMIDCNQKSIIDKIDFTLDQKGGVADAELVIETITEDLALKQELFKDIGAAAPSDAILASNTSGLRPTEIANGVPTYADRIIGCHWWNPPYLLPLVEIVPGTETSDTILDEIESIVESINRNPIRLNHDIPGFIWNRVQFAVLRECMYLAEMGVASISDIDAAVRDGYALRTATIGPFETVDLAGLPLFQTIADELYPELSTDQSPSGLFEEYLSEDRNGLDSGAGFYDYNSNKESTLRQRDEHIARIRQALSESS